MLGAGLSWPWRKMELSEDNAWNESFVTLEESPSGPEDKACSESFS
jgi:hypothetical protein